LALGSGVAIFIPITAFPVANIFLLLKFTNEPPGLIDKSALKLVVIRGVTTELVPTTFTP
jgi:hypothetical protein